CGEIMNLGLVPAVIDRLSRQHPRLVFTVRTAANLVTQFRDLRERRVDFVFGRMMSSIDDDLDAEILYEDPLLVVASEGSKWLNRRRTAPAELVDEPWCLSPHDGAMGTIIVQAFRAQGLEPPNLTVGTNSALLGYSMAHTGRFLSVAPASNLQLSGKRLGLKAVPVDLPIRPGPIGIVTLKNRTISPVAQLFIACAREVAKPLAKMRL